MFGILGFQFQKPWQASHWSKNVQRTVHLLRPIEKSVQKKTTNKKPPSHMEICSNYLQDGESLSMNLAAAAEAYAWEHKDINTCNWRCTFFF